MVYNINSKEVMISDTAFAAWAAIRLSGEGNVTIKIYDIDHHFMTKSNPFIIKRTKGHYTNSECITFIGNDYKGMASIFSLHSLELDDLLFWGDLRPRYVYIGDKIEIAVDNLTIDVMG